MNRDKAIEIAATAIPPDGHVPWESWAASVVIGADALLAAMGEPTACEHPRWYRVGDNSKWRCEKCNATSTQQIPTKADNATEIACCAATEARVVAEIAAYLDNGGYSGAGAMVRCGDWRAKEPVR